MSGPRKVLPGVAGLSREEMRVASKSFAYRWAEQDGLDSSQRIFEGDVYKGEARNWWLVAFAHAMEYARVQRAKEITG